jgi:toxin FitB
MVAFLLDTNVISEPRKPAPHPGVLAWMRRQADAGTETYISVLVVGEVRRGIDRVRPRDRRHADALEAWLANMVGAYADRILPITLAVAEEWGRIDAAVRPPLVDGLMAATAKVHHLTVVTRNVADFAGTGVPLVNPFDG